ncbi:MAG: hypothetical protein Q9170_001548 [Blastenia crenularia]
MTKKEDLAREKCKLGCLYKALIERYPIRIPILSAKYLDIIAQINSLEAHTSTEILLQISDYLRPAAYFSFAPTNHHFHHIPLPTLIKHHTLCTQYQNISLHPSLTTYL